VLRVPFFCRPPVKFLCFQVVCLDYGDVRSLRVLLMFAPALSPFLLFRLTRSFSPASTPAGTRDLASPQLSLVRISRYDSRPPPPHTTPDTRSSVSRPRRS